MNAAVASPWQNTEITLTAAADRPDPYGGVDVAHVTGPDGDVRRRPAFHDGGRAWRIRFAAPTPGSWRWRTDASADDPRYTAGR